MSEHCEQLKTNELTDKKNESISKSMELKEIKLDTKETSNLTNLPNTVVQIEGINDIFLNIKKIYLKHKSSTHDKFIVLVREVMLYVENLVKLSGSQKKVIVISILKEFVTKDTDLGSTVRQLLITFIETLLSHVIDELINVSKGKVGLNTQCCC